MAILLDGTGGVTTPGVVNTAGETIATTLSVTGVATLGAGAVLGTPASGNLANCTGVPTPAALSTATGSAPSYSCRAWVNFNGTGTVAIRASGNVSSITDLGTGLYTVNFTTAMPDANYAISLAVSQDTDGSQNSAMIQGGTTPAVGSFIALIKSYANINKDEPYVYASIFR